MTIRYGIISAAQIVPRFVAGLKASEEGVATAIAARELTKAQKMAAELGIPKAYGSYQELYEDQEIDVIYVATYNQGHYQVAKDALLAGKHVLVEKPFVLNWDEADELFAIAKEQNLFLMEAQKALFLPITQWVKEKIQAGVIGQVKYVRSTTSYPHIENLPWFHSIEAGGGAWRSSGGYPLQYLLHVLDTAVEEASGTVLMNPGETDRQCDISLILGNQVQANLFITTELDIPSELIFYGEKGKFVIPDFWKAQKAQLYINEQVEEVSLPHATEFVFEIDHLNHCLDQGLKESPIVTPQLTLETVEMAEKLYQQWLS